MPAAEGDECSTDLLMPRSTEVSPSPRVVPTQRHLPEEDKIMPPPLTPPPPSDVGGSAPPPDTSHGPNAGAPSPSLAFTPPSPAPSHAPPAPSSGDSQVGVLREGTEAATRLLYSMLCKMTCSL